MFQNDVEVPVPSGDKLGIAARRAGEREREGERARDGNGGACQKDYNLGAVCMIREAGMVERAKV